MGKKREKKDPDFFVSPITTPNSNGAPRDFSALMQWSQSVELAGRLSVSGDAAPQNSGEVTPNASPRNNNLDINPVDNTEESLYVSPGAV